MDRLLVLAVALFLALPMVSAQAAAAIVFSDPEEVYGWCAGYGASEAGACAQRHCRNAGGTNCLIALSCNDGWGAIAFATGDARGYGATCGVTNAWSARSSALARCMDAANARCHLVSTFQRNGNEMAEHADEEFEHVWFAQLLLQMRHHELGNADGEMGPNTRAAVKAFQEAIGEEPDGIADAELVERLIEANGGEFEFIDTIRRAFIADKLVGYEDVTYGHSSAPAPARSFPEVLAALDEGEQRRMMAVYLAGGGTSCTVPARQAYPLGDKVSEIWSVECAEGAYTVFISAGSRMITSGGSAPSGDAGPPGSSATGKTPDARPAGSGLGRATARN